MAEPLELLQQFEQTLLDKDVTTKDAVSALYRLGIYTLYEKKISARR